MTPQEQELIQNVANKLKASPSKTKDADAERLISQEIASQDDIVYKLTQAVLVQEMALKEMKSKSDFLAQQVEHYKKESERGTFSRMMGGTPPAPVAPAPVNPPSAFGGFMQTAAGVMVGVVAGNLIADALFGGDEEKAAEATAAAPAAEPATETATTETPVAETATETAAAEAPAPEAATEAVETAAVEAPAEETQSGFLGDAGGFASDYTSGGFASDAGFGSDGFSSEDSFASSSDMFGDDSGFDGGFEFEEEDV